MIYENNCYYNKVEYDNKDNNNYYEYSNYYLSLYIF